MMDSMIQILHFHYTFLSITDILIQQYQDAINSVESVHVHRIRIYLIVSMNAAHVSIQAAQFSEHATALLTEERLSSLGLCMHSLQHSTS